MLLLLMFVFQVPTFPVGVTGSFEVLAFTPAPQLIFLKKGTNCCSCQVGGAGVDCLQSSKEGFPQQLERTGPACLGSLVGGGDGHLSPPAWWEVWYSLRMLSRLTVFPAPQVLLAPLPTLPRAVISNFSDKTMLQLHLTPPPAQLSWGSSPSQSVLWVYNADPALGDPPLRHMHPKSPNSSCQKMVSRSFTSVGLHDAAETCWPQGQQVTTSLSFLWNIVLALADWERQNLLQRCPKTLRLRILQLLMRHKAFLRTLSSWFQRAALPLWRIQYLPGTNLFPAMQHGELVLRLSR